MSTGLWTTNAMPCHRSGVACPASPLASAWQPATCFSTCGGHFTATASEQGTHLKLFGSQLHTPICVQVIVQRLLAAESPQIEDNCCPLILNGWRYKAFVSLEGIAPGKGCAYALRVPLTEGQVLLQGSQRLRVPTEKINSSAAKHIAWTLSAGTASK